MTFMGFFIGKFTVACIVIHYMVMETGLEAETSFRRAGYSVHQKDCEEFSAQLGNV